MGILQDIKGFFTGSPAQMQTFGNLSPEQQAALSQVLQQLTSGQNTQAYGGQLTAPVNPLQQASLSAMEQAAMSAASPTSGTATSTQALTDIINAKPQDLTSYFKTAFVDPATMAFENQVMPALEGQFKGMAGYGSDFAKAAGTAASTVGTNIASQEAQAVQEALTRQQANKLSAATALPGVATADIQNLLSLQAGGGVAQATAQAPLSAAYSEFQRQQQAKQMNIQDILAALGIQTKSPVVVPGQAGFLQGAAAGVGQAATTKLLSSM